MRYRLLAIALLAAFAAACTPQDEWSEKTNWYESTKGINEEFPDVFYLVSTNILKEEGSLTALNTPEEKSILAKEMEHIENKVFGDSLNFFAPYYHQHTMEAMSLEKEQYDSLATTIVDEVYAAFKHYLKCLNEGRPIVLAGFSQGAMLAKELLKRMTPEEYGSIAAAYILGWGLSEEDVQSPQVRPAERADDAGVCISFNSVSDTSAVWIPVQNNAAYSINPVNWRTDAVPAAFEYKGQALSVSLDTTRMTLVVSGFDEPEPAFKPVWPSGCLHFYEIQFYNRFLRANALLRCSRAPATDKKLRKRESLAFCATISSVKSFIEKYNYSVRDIFKKGCACNSRKLLSLQQGSNPCVGWAFGSVKSPPAMPSLPK